MKQTKPKKVKFMIRGNSIELVNGHFACADCGAEITGVGGMVGTGKNAKIYCLKHYWEHKKKGDKANNNRQ